MTDDPKAAALARLEAAKAKRASIEARSTETAELATINRDADCEEVLAEAIAEFGVARVGAVKVGPHSFVFRSPSRLAYSQFLDSSGKTTESMATLVALSLYREVDRVRFNQALEQYPGLLGRAGSLVVKLSGAVEDEDAGK